MYVDIGELNMKERITMDVTKFQTRMIRDSLSLCTIINEKVKKVMTIAYHQPGKPNLRRVDIMEVGLEELEHSAATYDLYEEELDSIYQDDLTANLDYHDDDYWNFEAVVETSPKA